MSDLTDLEITRLCAGAMGIKVIEFSRNDPSCTYRLENGKNYYPLHDDAQCMALVKKFRLSITPMDDGSWEVDILSGPWSDSHDLNRAICLCVARMQQAKEKANA